MPGIIKRKNERYLLTGATGFLGSHIMAGLLLQGKKVVIAGRSSRDESLRHRIRKLLHWFGIKHLEGMLEFYETDFMKTRMGLGKDEYEHLCSSGLSIIHCASNTSFTATNREKVMTFNVESLSEILSFALKSKTPCFYYISSAYAAGTDHIKCPEAPVNSSRFTNVYEESKAAAEKAVSRRCKEGDLPYIIVRPSIVYGDSVTGRSIRFNALYYPVRFLKHIRDIYLNDLKNNNGAKAAAANIYINDEEVLHLPIRIFISNAGSINLIPVNYFTETFFSIMEKSEPDSFYHITSHNPETLKQLVLYTQRFLNVTGIKVIIGKSGADEMRNPAEELFDHFIKVYRPYLSDKRIFMRDNVDKATGGILPPDFTYEIFRKCISYAISADWGEKLFV